jgi:hypothetical protein
VKLSKIRTISSWIGRGGSIKKHGRMKSIEKYGEALVTQTSIGVVTGMKKSLIVTLITILITMVICQIIMPYYTFAASDNTNIISKSSITTGKNSITFDSAKELVLKNNRTLKNLKRSLVDYKKGYENALKAAENIGYEDFLEAPNHYIRMLLYKKMYLVPEQRKNAIIVAEDNIRDNEDRLITNLRSYYQSLLVGNGNIEIQKRKYALDKKRHNLSIIKYENGLITKLELEESEYNLLKAQAELSEVVRNYENTCRTFNLYIGSPIDIFYNKVKYEDLEDMLMYDFDFFYEEALRNRYEIQSIKRQINLKKLEMEILEKNQVHKIYTSVKKEHENLATSIKTLELDLEKTKLNIKKEIYSIFVDAVNADEAIKRAERNVGNLKRKLNLAKVRYNAGVLSELNVEQAEIEVKEAEISIKNAIYDYNTKIMMLYNLSGLYAITEGLEL